MKTKPIGHDVLTKRYDAAKVEIKRLRDALKKRYETIERLRKELVASKQRSTAIAVQRPKCGCRHCLEVAKGNSHA